MNVIHPTASGGLPAEPWVTDAEADILGDLRRVEAGFWNLPEDKAGEREAFREHIAELEKLIVMRLARRTTDDPIADSEDETQRKLRWLAAGERRARREAHLTAYAVIGISVFAALAAALRFSGIGG